MYDWSVFAINMWKFEARAVWDVIFSFITNESSETEVFDKLQNWAIDSSCGDVHENVRLNYEVRWIVERETVWLSFLLNPRAARF